ncbi:MAG: tetratricopeptide repeat protein, partial [Planctomycetota bacterium]
VGWWQTKWWAASGQSARAAAMLADINPDDSRYEEAIRLLGAVYLQLKEEVGNEPEAQRRLLAEATTRLQPVVTGAGNRWPAKWSDLQRRTAIVLAELHGGAYAQRLLTAAIDGKSAQSDDGKPARSNDGAPTPSGDGWRDTAVTRLTLVLVDAGDADAARRRLARTPIGNADAARRLLQSLESRLASRNRLAAGEVMLDVIRSSPAGPEQGRWKAPYAAAAYTALGQPDKAIQLYEPLVEQRPDDIRLQLNFAESLAASGRVDSLQRAISVYATVEQRTPKASGSWWDARVGRLRALAAAGEREKVTKLLKITRVLHPQLGGRSKDFARIEQS